MLKITVLFYARVFLWNITAVAVNIDGDIVIAASQLAETAITRRTHFWRKWKPATWKSHYYNKTKKFQYILVAS